MTTAESNLLELLIDINGIERKCKAIDSNKTIPKTVFEMLKTIKNKVADWGIENIVVERNRGGE